jgi:transaldolase
MELWLDSAHRGVIREAAALGVLHGVTMTPALIAASSMSLEPLLKELLDVHQGPIALDSMGSKSEEIVKYSEALHRFSPRMISKVPVTREGLRAIAILSQKQIPVMAAGVFDAIQLLLAARAGAGTIAVHYARICESEEDGVEVFQKMIELLRRYRYPSKILAAFLSTSEQVHTCAGLGADGVSMRAHIFAQTVRDHPWTLEEVSQLKKDWGKVSLSLSVK